MLSFCYNCHNNIKDINTGTILTKDRLILNKTCLFKKKCFGCGFKKSERYKTFIDTKFKLWMLTYNVKCRKNLENLD